MTDETNSTPTPINEKQLRQLFKKRDKLFEKHSQIEIELRDILEKLEGYELDDDRLEPELSWYFKKPTTHGGGNGLDGTLRNLVDIFALTRVQAYKIATIFIAHYRQTTGDDSPILNEDFVINKMLAYPVLRANLRAGFAKHGVKFH